MDRRKIINFIPKPSSSEVILYDLSLKELAGVDVFEKYYEVFPVFENKKERYLKLKEIIKSYNETINNIYLYKNGWSEDDYLKSLQDDQITYSKLYGDLKKVEGVLDTVNKKIVALNEKIKLQIIKEKNKIINDKENTDEKGEKLKGEILSYKETLLLYETNLEYIEKAITRNEEEFNLISSMIPHEGKFTCKYCGTFTQNESKLERIKKLMEKNIADNKKELKKLLKEKSNAETNCSYYKDKLRIAQREYQNFKNYKDQQADISLYKKSVTVLKMEASRDALRNQKEELVHKIEIMTKSSKYKSKEFRVLRERIEKYKLSIDNLNKMKEMKENLQVEFAEFKQLETDLKDIIKELDLYKKYISIYFKIIEKKAGEFCGQNYKFSIFKFEDYKLLETFDVYYKTINIENLNEEIKKACEEFLMKKFEIFE